MWGEKTGIFTNQDRTVHISDKAVEPPGEAKPDMEILIEYGQRLELKDKDGQRTYISDAEADAYRLDLFNKRRLACGK